MILCVSQTGAVMRRAPFCGGLARVYHLCVRGGGGAGTSVPLVCAWWGVGKSVPLVCAWGGVGKSVPLVCVGGGSQVHTTASQQQWTGGQFRSCRIHDVLPQVLGSPCTTVPPVPRLPLYHGSPCTMDPLYLG